MYKAKLKRDKKIEDYLQTSSWQEVQERFNGRFLQADESFELLWFVDVIYRCPGGATIQIQDQRTVSDEPTAELDASLENSDGDSGSEYPNGELSPTD